MNDSNRQEAKFGMDTPAGRTAAFVAVGLALLAVGSWLQLRPALRYRETSGDAAAAKVLFPDMNDASKAASLAITSFDEDMAALRTFKVLKSGGVWVLPSHQNYPADAKDHLAAAATELIDRSIIEVVSTSPGDHETYGVIEPDADKVKAGETGVGRLVDIRDAAGNRLARLVIGNEYKPPAGVDPGSRPLRYVRKAGQDPVYLVALDTSKFTTKFDDWIEKDLLKLSPWDVRRITIDDSAWSLAIDQAGNPMRNESRKSLINLTYDDKDAAWSLAGLTVFGKNNKPEKKELGPDEELASSKLNDLRNALGDLKIVDVVRKPSALVAELKAEKPLTRDEQDEAMMSLFQRGFFPGEKGGVIPSSGEVIVGMKDGVEYLLRFGNQTKVEGEADTDETTDEATEKPDTQDVGRYLFVLARVNEGLLEKPTLQPLPPLPDEAAPPPSATKPADPPAADKGVDTNSDEKTEDEAAADKASADTPADDKSEAVDALAKAEEAEAKAQAAIEKRRQVERENRLAQEAYDDKIKAAEKRVRELNARFADWYYVVSDAEYAKIRLGQSDVIQPKPKEETPASPVDEAAPDSDSVNE
jgi:hypothetical protein